MAASLLQQSKRAALKCRHSAGLIMAATLPPRGVRDVPAEHFIKAYAEHLKANDKIQLPSWVDIVKTGAFKELAPYDPDWYYVRAASLARKVYMRQNVGVGQFAKQYGGRNKRKGTVPEHYARASRGLIRHILKQLEDIDVVTKSTHVKGGRAITPNGQRDLDLIAGRIERAAEEDVDEEALED